MDLGAGRDWDGGGANEGRNTNNGIMEGRETKQDRTRHDIYKH
jgi:hypothetical protein